jgi:pimeloyl-ACP methyl ester carboxylesterase
MKINSKYVLVLLLVILIIAFSLNSQSLSSDCDSSSHTYKKEGFEVQTFQLSHKKSSQNPWIIILPPTGGRNFIDDQFAKLFCSENLNAIVLENWSSEIVGFGLEIHQTSYENAMRAIEVVIENLGTRTLGVFGTSLGGLHAAIALSKFDQIKVGYIVAWGGPTSYVIANSTQEEMEYLKAKRIDQAIISDSTSYEKELDKYIFLDPFKMEPKFQDKIKGMTLVLHDTVVPIEAQKRLKNLWQPELHRHTYGNHKFGIIINWLLHSKDIVKFFKTHLLNVND